MSTSRQLSTGSPHLRLEKETWNKAASTGILAEQGRPEPLAGSPLQTLKIVGLRWQNTVRL